MKNYRSIALAALLAMFTVISAEAQTRPAASPAGGASAPVPETKIAFVNTEAFGDEKVGISRFIAAVKTLDREFQPRQQELTNLQNQIKTIADDIDKLSKGQGVVSQQQIQDKQYQGDKLQRDLKAKQEQAQADYQKRYQEVVSPISEDIGKSLDAYAKSHGITMILDVSKLAPAILTANDGMDVTKNFITEYNSKNPATASTAAPARP